jgi:thiamine biosynthesis lipoprotein
MVAAGQGGSAELGRHEYRKIVMGVDARIVLYAPDEAAARAAARAAFARMERLEDAMSDWRADSELSRLNDSAGSAPVAVSDDLLRVLLLARTLADRTGGAFDPTVGLHASRAPRRSSAAPGAPDRAQLVLDAAAGTAQLARAGLALDLGAIGKGFACDEAFAELERRGLSRALVELGGDLYVGDAPPGRGGWLVEAGCEADGDRARTLVLERRGIATSDGAGAEVVVDPRVDPERWTARPDEAGRCFTVVAASGAVADGLATAAHVMGRHAARAWFADRRGALLYTDDARAEVLFDGATLAGWTPRGGRYDGDAVWTVEDGAIVGRTGPNGEGGLLYTEKEYAGFELELETWIDHPFDSGVFLRMLPPATGLKGPQVTLDYRDGGEIAGIYADGWWQHNVEAKAAFRAGDWNHLAIRCTGSEPRVDVWLNGSLVTSWTLPAGTEGFAERGRIGVQVHDAGERSDNAARFRQLRIRELHD